MLGNREGEEQNEPSCIYCLKEVNSTDPSPQWIWFQHKLILCHSGLHSDFSPPLKGLQAKWFGVWSVNCACAFHQLCLVYALQTLLERQVSCHSNPCDHHYGFHTGLPLKCLWKLQLVQTSVTKCYMAPTLFLGTIQTLIIITFKALRGLGSAQNR